MKRNLNLNSLDCLKLAFMLLVAFTILIFYFVINSSLETPFNIGNSVKARVSSFVPQGWAFFTRDAREEKWYAYEKKSDGKFVLRPPGSSYEYLFGLDRLGRRSSYPILLAGVDSLKWTEFYGTTDSLLEFSKKSTPMNFVDKIRFSSECKEVIIIKKTIRPWAWSNFKNSKSASNFLRINVNCKFK